jgi:hypothetical protein
MAKKTNLTPTQRKAIYITWHYTTHGIAYMKHILTAFYRKDFKIGDEQSKPLDQEKLQTYWDNPNLRVAEDGFLFEKVFLSRLQRRCNQTSILAATKRQNGRR